MDTTHFDALTRWLSTAGSRRGLLTLLPLAGAFATLFGEERAAAKRRQRTLRRRRVGRREQVQEQRKKRKKKKKRKHPSPPASPSPICAQTCAGCCSGETCAAGTSAAACGANGAPCVACGNPVPACINQACAACTSHAQCPANHLCHEGSCQPCDVCESGCPFDSVQEAIEAAIRVDTLFLCAGDYAGNITIDRDLKLIGAGDSLPAPTRLAGTGDGSVVTIAAETLVTLQTLRITGGHTAGFGGGILNNGDLLLNGCTVIANTADLGAGGIDNEIGCTANLTLCTVRENTAGHNGGGIRNGGYLLLNDSDITANDAVEGGGIYNRLMGTITLLNGASITGNTATGGLGSGGGILNFGSLNPTGGSITGNTPDDCVNTGGGTGCP